MSPSWRHAWEIQTIWSGGRAWRCWPICCPRCATEPADKQHYILHKRCHAQEISSILAIGCAVRSCLRSTLIQEIARAQRLRHPHQSSAFFPLQQALCMGILIAREEQRPPLYWAWMFCTASVVLHLCGDHSRIDDSDGWDVQHVRGALGSNKNADWVNVPALLQ